MRGNKNNTNRADTARKAYHTKQLVVVCCLSGRQHRPGWTCSRHTTSDSGCICTSNYLQCRSKLVAKRETWNCSETLCTTCAFPAAKVGRGNGSHRSQWNALKIACIKCCSTKTARISQGCLCNTAHHAVLLSSQTGSYSVQWHWAFVEVSHSIKLCISLASCRAVGVRAGLRK